MILIFFSKKPLVMSILPSSSQTSPDFRSGSVGFVLSPQKASCAPFNLLSDSELVNLFMGGSSFAFGSLVLRYQAPIFRCLLAKTRDYDAAQDVWQEALISVASAMRNGSYSERGRFGVYLRGVVFNKLRDSYRRKSAKREDLYESVSSVFSDRSVVPLDDVLERESRLDFVERQMSALPPRLRDVVVRRYQGLTFAQISEELNLNINTALSQFQSGLRLLRKAAEVSGI